MTTRQVWKFDDQGRPTRLVTVQTIKPRSKAPQAVLALVVVALLVAAVFGNARQYRANVAQATTTGGN